MDPKTFAILILYITSPCRSCQNIAIILTNSEKRDRIFIMDYFIESKGKKMKLKEKSKYYVFPHITMSLWWIFFSFIVFILAYAIAQTIAQYLILII